MSNVNDAAVPPTLKRRKLVDKSLPTALDEIAEENALYQELQRMERSLDWTMSRKRMEIQEAFGKPVKVRRKLRIFLSHAMSGQVWQEPVVVGAGDLETGQPIPAWTFRIEGRLLDASTQRLNRGPSRKFSSFLKSMVVEFDRDPTLYPESNIVEVYTNHYVSLLLSESDARHSSVSQWHRFDSPEAQDGFEIKRRGDMAVKARVILHLEHTPEHFKVNEATLAGLIGVQEDTRVGIIAGLWNYIKANGLQDKVHPTTIKFDQKLAAIFNLVEINFSALPELVNRYLSPPDPIALQHVIHVEQSATSPNMQAFDVDVDMDDTTLKQKMNQTLLSYGAEAQATLTALDEEASSSWPTAFEVGSRSKADMWF
ncbi:SWI/SNF complex component snf12 [Tulasnella sp. 332]|nr:SWI/SNF complex component snf12 [Tulasnella sp. 332]